MKNRALTILTIALISIGFMYCGSESKEMGFTESFRADDTVSESIFEKSEGSLDGIFKMMIVSKGISSGYIKLNDNDIKGPSDFKNVDFNETLDVDLFDKNTIEVEVRGKPGDQLCVQIYEIEEGEDIRVIFERCVDREAGPPNKESIEFDIQED